MSFDIHFQVSPEEQQLTTNGKVFEFGFTRALGVKGPQKLVNRWLKCLMTLKGTDLLDKSYGTGFPQLIGSNISREQDFTDAMALFVSDCTNQITALDDIQFPPTDERLASGTLTRVVPRGDSGYDCLVTLKNVAGTLLTVEVPTGTTRT